ncbi:MAG: hypothetical protein DIU56_003550 [Pseudomonadota bacterium]
MKRSILAGVMIAAALAASPAVRADCAADSTVADVRRAHAKGEEHERAGRMPEALYAYVKAQDYTCDPNPVEADAAKRAAALSLPLASEAEKKGDLETAFDLYERGGHYAAADRVLMARLRANPDDTVLVARALQHFRNRALPAFQSNNRVRLAAAGAYTPDAALLAEVTSWPAQAAERAFEREAKLFHTQYLAERVKLEQSRPDDPTDIAALQSAGAREQAFVTRWPEDPLEASRRQLGLVHIWAGMISDRAVSERLAQRVSEIATQRAALLVQKYREAPSLLDAAMAYHGVAAGDPGLFEQRAGEVKRLALWLGDQAKSHGRYTLAAAYYEVADAKDRAEAMRETQRQLALQKMQPRIEQAQRAAQDLARSLGDPAQVSELRRQAEEARKAIEQSRSSQPAKSADDLERELGL